MVRGQASAWWSFNPGIPRVEMFDGKGRSCDGVGELGAAAGIDCRMQDCCLVWMAFVRHGALHPWRRSPSDHLRRW